MRHKWRWCGKPLSSLPREPADPPDDVDLVRRPFVGAVEGVVRDYPNLGRIIVGDVLEPLGDQPHSVEQDKDTWRGGRLPRQIDEHDVAGMQGGPSSFELGVEATRTEPANDAGTEPERGIAIRFKLGVRF